MNRRRILFAWEMGANYGHAAKIAEVARELAGACDVVVAARDPAEFRRIVPDLPVTLLPAPHGRARGLHPGEASPANFPAMLATEGWDSAQTLTALIEAWRSLFRLIAPDLLVAQAAPTALLAARGQGLGTVVLGSGYDNPPLADPMPCFDRASAQARALAGPQEAAVLATANAALGASGTEPAARFRDIVAGDLSLLMTWAFVDHYAPRAEVQPDHPPYLGQLLAVSAGAERHWSGKGGARILAYLRPGSPAAQAGFGALHRLGAQHDIILAAPGISDRDAATLRAAGVQVENGPVRLDRLVPDCALGISHASNGVAAVFAISGVPQIGLPTHREQALCARSVARAGLGLGMEGKYDAEAVIDTVRHALQSERIRRAVHDARLNPDTENGRCAAARAAAKILEFMGDR